MLPLRNLIALPGVREVHARLLDGDVRAFRAFARERWNGLRRSRPDRPVVLLEFSEWPATILCQAYVANFLAGRVAGRIECYDFRARPGRVPYRRWRMEQLYAAFGARLRLTAAAQAGVEAQARSFAREAGAHVRTKADVERITADGLPIGDLIYDTYLRMGHYTVSPGDPALRETIAQAYGIYLLARAYLDQHDVRAVCPIHTVHIWSGILVRLALHQGIPCYRMYDYSFNDRFELTNFALQQFRRDELPLPNNEYPRYREIFAALPRASAEQRRAGGRRLIEQRLSGLVVNEILVGKSAYAPADAARRLLRPTPVPKILLLASCFFDDGHLFRWMLFPDFWEWITFTLDRARRTPFEWYVKPHPGGLPGNEAVFAELERRYPEITFLHKDDSNRQIVAEGIQAMFTVHSGAAHEFAYMGIPVVCAGDNIHIAYSFNLHARTVEEYAGYIEQADRLQVAINREEIDEFVYMHYLHFRRNRHFPPGWPDADVFRSRMSRRALEGGGTRLSPDGTSGVVAQLVRGAAAGEPRLRAYLEDFFAEAAGEMPLTR